MPFNRYWNGLIVFSVLMLSACSSATPPDVATNTASLADAQVTIASPVAMQKDATVPAPSSASSAAWLSIPLTNVRNGQTFAIADFKGKIVLLENMAIWCTTCLRQQNQLIELHELLGQRTDLVSLGLDIDPNEDGAMLKSYIDGKGFNWIYAVVPPEMVRAIGQLYGAQFLNPPSAPMLIIDRDAQVHALPFGVKSAADLQIALEPFLSEIE